MQPKTNRRKVVQQLIATGRYEDQQSLVQALHEKGFSVTQAAVSRDLKEIGACKKIDAKGSHYVLDHMEVEKEILRRGVKRIQHNGVMIVVHTVSGLADFVGDMIDASGLDFMGSLAGENTVFVAPTDINKIEYLCKQLKVYLCLNH